jgi:hypothetical protein
VIGLEGTFRLLDARQDFCALAAFVFATMIMSQCIATVIVIVHRDHNVWMLV